MISRRGWVVLCAAVVLYLGAVVWHYPEFGLLAAGGFISIAVGLAWVVYRPNLRIDRVIEPTRVTRGDIALARLSVVNGGRIAVSEMAGEERCGAQIVPVRIPRLKPGASEEMTYRLPSDARGIFDVGPLAVVRQDPFGFWRRVQRLRIRRTPLRLPAGAQGASASRRPYEEPGWSGVRRNAPGEHHVSRPEGVCARR